MTTSVDMVGVEAGGVVSEDVMAELYNLSPVDRPLIDSIGRTTSHNPLKEFTDKELSAASAANAYYQNQDLSAVDDTNFGLRYGNYHQIMLKSIKMSTQGRASKTTYDEDEYLLHLVGQIPYFSVRKGPCGNNPQVSHLFSPRPDYPNGLLCAA